MNSNSLASHLRMRFSSVGHVDWQELKHELNVIANMFGLAVNMVGLLFGLGMVAFGQTDEYRAAGVFFGIAFACGTYRLIRDLKRFKKVF